MNIAVPDMQELLEAGVHFGHKVSRGHPKMKKFIFGARDGVSIIDLEQSEKMLREAAQAIYNLGKEGKTLLIIGTKKQAQDLVESLATEAQTPFLTEKWIGGLLTNFDELKRNFKKLLALKEEKEKGTLQRTKKEQLLISRKLNKFNRNAGGVATMEKIPDAIFVVDAIAERTALVEAGKMDLLIFGLCDTNADPNWFNFPVPANDDGIKSLKLVCETMIRAYAKGKVDGGMMGAVKAEMPKVAEAPKEPKVEVEVAAEKEEVAVLEEEVEKEIVKEQEKKA